MKTTGIFCRPSCKSKSPKRKNVAFFDTAEQARESGLRPCKRCRPDLLEFQPLKEAAEKIKAVCDRYFQDHTRLKEELSELGLSRFGVAHASCIDAGMIEDILGCSIRAKKDANQRPACGCAESVELGTYDCCPHGCIYCYATSSTKAIEKNIALHDPKSPVLIGRLPDMVSISHRRMNSVKDGQIRLF